MNQSTTAALPIGGGVKQLRAPKRPPIKQTINGRHCVLIPLSGSDLPAIVDQYDYDNLQSLGLSQCWHFNSNGTGSGYVRAAFNGESGSNNHQVARIITQAGRRQVVRYRNGNTRDLTRFNLIVEGSYESKAEQRQKPNGLRKASNKTLLMVQKRMKAAAECPAHQ